MSSSWNLALVVLIISSLFCITVSATTLGEASTTYLNICPFESDLAEFAIAGYNINAGMKIAASGEDAIILSSANMYQQEGISSEQATDPDGQGYSYGLNGQGTFEYASQWANVNSEIDTQRALDVTKGRLNPSSEQFMMGYVNPASDEEPYADNESHLVYQEMAMASHYADIIGGSYVSTGSTGPGLLDSMVAVTGLSDVRSTGAYNAFIATARNVTENETVIGYTIVNGKAVPYTYTAPVTRIVVTPAGIANYHENIQFGGKNINFVTQFNFKSTKSGL